jgi:hypothetical protein
MARIRTVWCTFLTSLKIINDDSRPRKPVQKGSNNVPYQAYTQQGGAGSITYTELNAKNQRS